MVQCSGANTGISMTGITSGTVTAGSLLHVHYKQLACPASGRQLRMRLSAAAVSKTSSWHS